MELMNALLLSLPGTPVLYYGDEIGMGDNLRLGDRTGVRTPMQWSPAPNAGFSSADAGRLVLPLVEDPEYHWRTVNVETQARNESSLLNWTKRLIALRGRHRCFGRGGTVFVDAGTDHALAFVRACPEDRVLCVFNLSRYTRPLSLDLSRWSGLVPVEMFGGRFPPPATALAPDARPARLLLVHFGAGMKASVLVALDFGGTLAAIRREPAAAQPGARGTLWQPRRPCGAMSRLRDFCSGSPP
jgi:hypothetical protein